MLASSPIVPFQLTTSQGGRHLASEARTTDISLSTHDLTRRSTLIMPTALQVHLSFNSRPHKEVDGNGMVTHLLEEVFQLTTSQGGRHFAVTEDSRVYSFQLTTSQGGRLYGLIYLYNSVILSTHDLTRRSTCYRRFPDTVYCLSTHDLTRRST